MPNKRQYRIFKLWLPVFIIAGAIFYASSLPGSRIPSLFPYQDILFHFFIFSSLALFFSRALKYTFGIAGIKIIIFTFIFAFFYGISDEFHQSFVPYRNASAGDVFIDAIGGFLGSLFYSWPK